MLVVPEALDVAGLYSCWWCGRRVLGGICLGPHTDYNHSIAKGLKHVFSVRGEPFRGRKDVIDLRDRKKLRAYVASMKWEPEPYEEPARMVILL